MSNRKKTMLMMFVDYLICLLLELFGLIVFAWMLNFSWGYPAYSVLFTLVLFGMLYSRAHNAAERNRKRKELKPVTEGLLLAVPLTVFNLLVILIFTLMQYNIIPVRDVLMNTLYSFPDDAPRVVTKLYLIDYITPIVRVWFGHLVGFMQEGTSPLLLLISPLITLAASFAGYFAGMKQFYISDVIFKTKEKVKEKFNE